MCQVGIAVIADKVAAAGYVRSKLIIQCCWCRSVLQQPSTMSKVMLLDVDLSANLKLLPQVLTEQSLIATTYFPAGYDQDV